MLSTIVLSLLAIWLSIVIIGQLIGFGVGYSIYKSLSTPEKNSKLCSYYGLVAIASDSDKPLK